MTSIQDIVLTHHSGRELILDDRDYVQPDRNHKPAGLWLSDDADYGWKEWCTDESWNVDSLVHTRNFVFTVDANILWLSTLEEIVAFSNEYSTTIAGINHRLYIDWKPIVEKYDGILITPYQWQARMSEHTFWYYSWDVASACVWNTKVLKEVSNANAEAVG